MNASYKSWIVGLILSAVFVGGLYFGTGGYSLFQIEKREKERLTNTDPKSMSIETVKDNHGNDVQVPSPLASLALEKFDLIRIYPWLQNWPDGLSMIVTSLAFGALGGIARIIRGLIWLGQELADFRLLLIPLYSAMIGFMVLGISHIIPGVLTSGDVNLEPTSLLFFSFFSGMFSEKFTTWVESNMSSIYKKDSNA